MGNRFPNLRPTRHSRYSPPTKSINVRLRLAKRSELGHNPFSASWTPTTRPKFRFTIPLQKSLQSSIGIILHIQVRPCQTGCLLAVQLLMEKRRRALNEVLGYPQRTVWKQVTEAGYSWKSYSQEVPSLIMFNTLRLRCK